MKVDEKKTFHTHIHSSFVHKVFLTKI